MTVYWNAICTTGCSPECLEKVMSNKKLASLSAMSVY